MNIETEQTVEEYEYHKRWLERKRLRTCREKRDAVTAELRERGQPLFRIILVHGDTAWACHADRDAIRTFREDGYEIQMKAERFKEIAKARPGSRQMEGNFTDSDVGIHFSDEKEGKEPEPWVLVSFFEVYPHYRGVYD